MAHLRHNRTFRRATFRTRRPPNNFSLLELSDSHFSLRNLFDQRVFPTGGFIKEFVNASMAYAEGPNLSKTRSQTRQSLGWRTLLNPAGLPSQTAAQPLDGVNSPPGAFSLQGPLQIQRTFGHNNFVSFRAVDESGRSESFAGQAQKTFEIALEPSCDGAAETLTPKRLRFGQHDVAGPASPVSSPSSGSAPVEVGGNPPNGGDRAAGVAVANGARFGDERRKAAAVYPGRPRNTSVYEFEIKRLEGRRGTPQFTVKMVRTTWASDPGVSPG